MTTTLCVTDSTVADPVAAPVLAAVLDCVLALYDELQTKGITAPCAAAVVSGAAPALDRGLDETAGCCGQLWVRLVSLYPSTEAFPDQDATPRRLEDMSWAVQLEVGLVRPAPVIQEVAGEAVLPPMEEEQEAAAVAVTDAAIIRQALMSNYAEDQDVAVVLGAFVPFGPDGGIVGGATNVTVQVV